MGDNSENPRYQARFEVPQGQWQLCKAVLALVAGTAGFLYVSKCLLDTMR